ncbi:hypothetical protein JHD97_11835, partial [Kocuria rhizophila]|nr:hypothetical protein [Kocuria rhizophila]
MPTDNIPENETAHTVAPASEPGETTVVDAGAAGQAPDDAAGQAPDDAAGQVPAEAPPSAPGPPTPGPPQAPPES